MTVPQHGDTPQGVSLRWQGSLGDMAHAETPDTLKAVSRTLRGAQSWGRDGSAGSTWCQHPTTSCCTDSPKILPVPLGKQRDHAVPGATRHILT